MARSKSKVITVRVLGPLSPDAEQFRLLLAERGYTPLTRVTQLQVMAHLSKWLQARGLGVADLNTARFEEYLAARRAGGYASFCSWAGLGQLVEVLTRCGAPLQQAAAAPDSPLEVLLAGYARYLRQERGLADSTISAYVLRARRFLIGYGHGADVTQLGTAAVTHAVLRESQTLSAGSAQFFAVALRSFLRYCHLTGATERDLSAASLPVTGRRREALPRGISTAQARALLAACDRRTSAGRRDYAVILLLLRLGLRACEVAALQLEDLDWRAGELTVHGKAHRVDRLPLPGEVGAAMAAYLRHGPRRGEHRELFLRTLAPRGGLSREAIGCIVRRASVRAGLTPFGPHRLRHALACDMVRAGVPLGQIGQVLRHADATSTSIYARVDLEQLRTVARPWPGQHERAER